MGWVGVDDQPGRNGTARKGQVCVDETCDPSLIFNGRATGRRGGEGRGGVGRGRVGRARTTQPLRTSFASTAHLPFPAPPPAGSTPHVFASSAADGAL